MAITVQRKHLLNGLSAVLFKIGWAVCLWSAVSKQPAFTLWTSLGSLSILIYFSTNKRADVLKMVLVLFFGPVIEAVNLQLGFYHLTLANSYPLWLISFWPVFAILFFSVIKLFYGKNIYTNALVGFSGGLGYFCGQWLGLLKFNEPTLVSLVCFSVVWALEFLILLWASRKIDSVVTS